MAETARAARDGRVLLWGPMGAGKSSVGRALAPLLGRSFIDLDEAIERAAGCSTAELFAREGEAGFRLREAAALELALETRPGTVIAVGGGALLDARAREAALRASLVIGLQAPAAALVERLERSASTRPLLAGPPGALAARVDQLLQERAAAYAVAHLQLSTDGVTAEEVAARIARRIDAGLFPITIDRDHAYSARLVEPSIGGALLELAPQLAPSSSFLITDANVAALHLEGLRAALTQAGLAPASVITLEPGEEHKTLERAAGVLDKLIEGGADRRSLVIGFGGGVVTDIAGFVASTFSRGIPWLAVPTTTMGMVDAATGGKTAVNLRAAKNSVGTFHHPRAVLVDASFVASESTRAIRSGLAESIKAAAVADAELFGWLEEHAEALAAASPPHVRQAIVGGLRVKCALVEADPEDRSVRALLNFGHTVGHALESASGFTRFTHGEAVAIGMVAACRIGTARGVTGAEVASRVQRLLERVGLPTEIPAECREGAAAHLHTDKKRLGRLTHYVLLHAIGRAAVVPLESNDLAAAIRDPDHA